MKTPLALCVAGLLAVPALADGRPAPRPAAPAPPRLTTADREVLAHLLKKAAANAKPRLAYAATTPAEARQLADVPAALNWQAEYEGWFVFGVKSAAGGPDEWTGVIFVRKGTNVTGYFRQSW